MFLCSRALPGGRQGWPWSPGVPRLSETAPGTCVQRAWDAACPVPAPSGYWMQLADTASLHQVRTSVLESFLKPAQKDELPAACLR